MMRAVSLCAAAAIFAAGCASEPSPQAHGTTEWIVDGTPTSGDEPAVVLVFNRAGGLCTGTLIAPRVVLTAKHCVQNAGASEPNPASAFVIGIGDNIRGLSQNFGVSQIRTTPGVYSSGSGGLGGALVGIDVALMTLSTGATITPIPVRRETPTELIGEPAKAVGFGETPGGGAGQKFRTMSSATGVMGGVIFTGPTICQGDSGGPLISEAGEVFGVASFGQGPCGAGVNGYNRIDTFLDLIDEAVGDSGSCLGDGAEICDGFDNDCDDAVDEDCANIGEPCTEDAECITLMCADTAGGRVCTQPCDLLRPFLGCPSGTYCGGDGGCEGLCVPGDAGTLGNDADCVDDTDCFSLNCMDPGDGRSRCLDPCEGDDGMCLAGEVCAAVAGSCGGCVPAEIVTGTRGMGEPCIEGAACLGGACFVEEGSSYCTRACTDDSECGELYHCRDDGEGGTCVRGERGGTGSPCVHNDDCSESLFCAVRGDGRWCTSFCTTEEECPPAFACTSVGEDVSVCAPSGGGVLGEPCASGDMCISGECQATGLEGELLCTRRCSTESSCGPGFGCVRAADGVNAVCVPEPAPVDPPGDGGCSCSVGGRSTGAAHALAGLGLLALIVVRRRRS